MVSLVVAALFYLQFGLQALVHYLPQGALSLVGAATLGWGAALRMRWKPASSVVLVGTFPILALHAALTLIDPGEMPFLIGSIPVPVAAAIALIRGRDARRP